MEKDNKSSAPSSLIPVLIAGGTMLVVMQFFGGGSTSKEDHKFVPSQKPAIVGKLADFEFPRGAGSKAEIDTGNYHIILSSQGGRIEKVYAKSHDDLKLPEVVISSSDDELAKKLDAIEITRGNGLDFQPHLYYYDDPENKGGHQLGHPVLNNAAFSVEGNSKSANGTVKEIRYKTQVTFKGHRLELLKLFRFYDKENFFHQITVLRNLEKRDFQLGGPLYFKSFGDAGPAPDAMDDRQILSYGRFYRYDDSLTQRTLTPPSNDFFSFLGFGEKRAEQEYSAYFDKPNTLEFYGGMSRYFLSYSKFLSGGNPLNDPDGVALRNQIDPTGNEAYTAILNDFRLAASSGEPVNLGSLNNLDVGTANRAIVEKSQQRTDALILDNMVYMGLRNDESHAFNNHDLMKREFGLEKPDSNARGVVYSSSFLALFASVRDGIVFVMRWLQNYLGNYGWVIIIIAVGFKLLTFPLNQMQTKSMKRMTLIKPELEKLNEKYKDNPQEKQKRLMALYKENNINPAKGCLPMLIQIPIFIALYSAFSESIELWRSPFILWMTDLSQPDTIYTIKDLFVLHNFHINVLPLVMVGSQLLQQRLTTVVTDPQQKAMMYLMPVIMLFFFWSMPSGVTLYWTVQNIIAILWQLVANRMDDSTSAKS